MGTHEGSATGVSAIGGQRRLCHCQVLRSRNHPRVFTLREPTRGTPPVTSECERGCGGAGGRRFPAPMREKGRLRLD